MRYIDTRSGGGLSWECPWPSQVPPLRRLELPTRLCVPAAALGLAQVARPAGTLVARGEALTEAQAEATSVLAPTSGRIVGSSTVTLLGGPAVPAIDLEPDFQDRVLPGEPPLPDVTGRTLQHADLAQWIPLLRAAGLWTARRGSPSLLDQLVATLQRPADTVLCSLLDADPPLRLNALLGNRAAAAMVAGVDLLRQLTGARQALIVVEAGAPSRWWTALERLALQHGIEMLGMPHHYPQSDPSVLLYNVLQLRLRPQRLPIEQGVLLLDGAAAVAVGRFAARQQPMLQVPIAVADLTSGRSHYVIAPVGTPLEQLLRQLGIVADTLYASDLLRHRDIGSAAVAGPAELAVHAAAAPSAVAAGSCIRCAWCAQYCPTAVLPAGLLDAAQDQDAQEAERCGLASCIECGVCSAVCPTNLPLAQAIVQLRRQHGLALAC